MQGGQGPRWSREPGRGVYAARRIVAALVILLLLVLLLPRACQALFGPGEEAGLEAPGRTITSEDTVAGVENTVVEQEVIVASSPAASETEADGGTDETGGGESESGEAPNVEAVANLAPVIPGPEVAVAGTNGIGSESTEQTPPVPSVESSIQPPPPPPPQEQVVQPVAVEEPVFFERPIFFEEEPIPFEEPVLLEEKPVLEELPSNTTTTPTAIVGDNVGAIAEAGAAVAIA